MKLLFLIAITIISISSQANDLSGKISGSEWKSISAFAYHYGPKLYVLTFQAKKYSSDPCSTPSSELVQFQYIAPESFVSNLNAKIYRGCFDSNESQNCGVARIQDFAASPPSVYVPTAGSISIESGSGGYRNVYVDFYYDQASYLKGGSKVEICD